MVSILLRREKAPSSMVVTELGIITEYRNDNGNKMIRVNDKFIPYNKDFITKIDKENKKIYMHDIGVFL